VLIPSISSRMANSSLTAARQFKTRDSGTRDMPSFCAAAVTDRPISSSNSRRSSSPGCGGLCIIFNSPLSMVIQIINQLDAASGKAKHDPPIAVDPDRPVAAPVPLELVAFECLQGNRFRPGGGIQDTQDQPQPGCMVRLDTFGRACLVKRLKSFMAEARYHDNIVSREDTCVKRYRTMPNLCARLAASWRRGRIAENGRLRTNRHKKTPKNLVV